MGAGRLLGTASSCCWKAWSWLRLAGCWGEGGGGCEAEKAGGGAGRRGTTPWIGGGGSRKAGLCCSCIEGGRRRGMVWPGNIMKGDCCCCCCKRNSRPGIWAVGLAGFIRPGAVGPSNPCINKFWYASGFSWPASLTTAG